MKAFLMPGLTTPDISPLARVICLHGLLSVAFDLNWRSLFLLGELACAFSLLWKLPG
jgi:hypothetical protein